MPGSHAFAQPARYLVVAASVGLALLVALGLARGSAVSPFPILLTAVMFGAWYGGLGPAVLATGLATVALDYFFEAPSYSFEVASRDALVEMGVFLGAALLISGLSASLRRARYEAEAATHRVRELERAETQRAVVEERARIARDMHDGLAKSLAGLALEARALAQLVDSAPEPSRSKAAYLAELSEHLAQEARAVIYDVRLKRGTGALVDQLRLLLADWEAASGVSTELNVRGEPAPIALQLEYEVLRIVEEALSNVQRHADARQVVVELAPTTGGLTLAVRDDGRGFPWRDEWPALASAGHFGLLGMRERAAHVGAYLQIVSAPDAGTVVRLQLPPAACPERPTPREGERQ